MNFSVPKIKAQICIPKAVIPVNPQRSASLIYGLRVGGYGAYIPGCLSEPYKINCGFKSVIALNLIFNKGYG